MSGQKPDVAIVIGAGAPELERFAATELQRYISQLFGLTPAIATNNAPYAEQVVLLGNTETNPAVAEAMGGDNWSEFSDQGFLLRKAAYRERPALVVGGGSPAATLWAAYELLECYGVRYLLGEDVFPEDAGSFRLPDVDVKMEPDFRIRAWRGMNDFPMGPESWGIADYRQFLDQLAKLKFNMYFLSFYPYHPFVHYEFRGVKKTTGELWFGWRYPIEEDTIGKEHFGDQREFMNPDFKGCRSYEEKVAGGQKLAHAILAHAKARGMKTGIAFCPTEVPPEFKSLLPAGADVDDPKLVEMTATVVRAYVNTYPEADYYILGMPEWRSPVGVHERCWRRLDEKYGIEGIISLEQILAEARARVFFSPGRAEEMLLGDIEALYLLDKLFTEERVLEETVKPDARLVYGDVADELYPVMHKLLPENAEFLGFVDYTAFRVAKRLEPLAGLKTEEVGANFILTLQDDNVGVVSQLATGAVSQLLRALHQNGWQGYYVRQWMNGDLDPCVAYLARAAWEVTSSPEAVYTEHIASICGQDCVPDLLKAFQILEESTRFQDEHFIGLGFPVPGGLVTGHWKAGEPIDPRLEESRNKYQQALKLIKLAHAKARPGGRAYLDYFIGRLEFTINLLDLIGIVRQASVAYRQAKEAGNKELRRSRLVEAARMMNRAVMLARRALEGQAKVVRDQSDRGALAAMNEYIYKPAKAYAHIVKLESEAWD